MALGEIFVFTIDVGITSFSVLLRFSVSLSFSSDSANLLSLIKFVSEILPLLYAYIPHYNS